MQFSNLRVISLLAGGFFLSAFMACNSYALSGTLRSMPEQPTIAIDGIQYPQSQIFNDIANAIIQSDQIRSSEMDSAGPEGDEPMTLFLQDRMKQSYPWMAEYIYRENGTPRFFAVNKWAEPVKIFFGYPNNLEPAGDIKGRISDSGWIGHDATLEAKFVETLKPLTPSLAEWTGLPIDLDTASPAVQQVNGIHIIISDPKGWETPYRRGRHVYGYSGDSYWDTVNFRTTGAEDLLKDAVHFSARAPQSVEGFLLTDDKNNIHQSYCYISKALDGAFLKNAIQQCLMRSLGITGASWMQHLTAKVDPRSVLRTELGDERTKAQSTPEYSAYDEVLVRTLYSKKFAPGMSYRDVMNELYKK
ncbi:MAG: hypothetical protein PW788_07025 [Micavibrio sp.]|nr:hypothetical protein [Micavibrio sp.]